MLNESRTMNVQYVNEAVYIYSFEQWKNSFKPKRLYFWARTHKLVARGLDKPNLIEAFLWE